MYPNTAGPMETGRLFPATISGNTGMPSEPLTQSAGILFSLQCQGAIRTNVFLDLLSKEFPEDQILLICDGAAWHKSQSLVIPANIHLAFIPPYTPEMNPIEQVWKEIPTRGFKNEVFKTLEGVVDRLYKTVKDLSSETIKSITGRKWIIELF